MTERKGRTMKDDTHLRALMQALYAEDQAHGRASLHEIEPSAIEAARRIRRADLQLTDPGRRLPGDHEERIVEDRRARPLHRNELVVGRLGQHQKQVGRLHMRVGGDRPIEPLVNQYG